MGYLSACCPKGQESMIAGTDNFKLDTTNYKAPDYGYAGLKYAKATDNFDRNKLPGNGAEPRGEGSEILEEGSCQWNQSDRDRKQ